MDILDEHRVRIAVGLGLWKVPGREAEETVRVFRQGNEGARTWRTGTVERVSWRDRGTVGESVGEPWKRGRDAVGTDTWVKLGKQSGRCGNWGQRGIAAGKHKEIKINSFELNVVFKVENETQR